MNEETTKQVPVSTASSIEGGKNMAIIAYITIFGLLAAFIMNNDIKNSFTTYHIRQSLGLGALGLSFVILNLIPFIGWIVTLILTPILIVFWVLGLLNAINGKEKPIPVVGEYFQEWFKNL